jgi:hypothetical protein
MVAHLALVFHARGYRASLADARPHQRGKWALRVLFEVSGELFVRLGFLNGFPKRRVKVFGTLIGVMGLGRRCLARAR